jgi:hypothetical protein
MELMMVLREFFKETGFRENKTESLVRERTGRLVCEHR